MADFDATSVIYHVIANGRDIKDRIKSLSWTEGANEVGTIITFACVNWPESDSAPATQTGHWMHEFLKVGMLIVINAESNIGTEEVARGFIQNWKTTSTLDEQTVTIKTYDQLIALKKSSINKYFQKGTATAAIYNAICDECSITRGTYQGPSVSHNKTTYRSTNAQKAIEDAFEYARRQGAKRVFLCDRKGKACVYPYGYNQTQWIFMPDKTLSVTNERDITDMVTRVQVIGQQDKEGRSPVVSTKNGLTSYGIRQKIVTQDKDDKTGKAQQEAAKILEFEGKMKEKFTLKAPDVPYLHKGEAITVVVSTLRDIFWVVGVTHDADANTMTMDLRLPRNFGDTYTKLQADNESKSSTKTKKKSKKKRKTRR